MTTCHWLTQTRILPHAFSFEADANGVLIRKLDASTPEGRFRRDLFE